MILVFGGAYQGKLEFVKETYSLTDEDVCFCEEEKCLDYSKKVIYGLESWILDQVKNGKEEKEILEACSFEKLKDNIVICTDVSQGIVPLERNQRFARETTGRAMVALGKNAESVYRVFCGLSQKLK